MGLLGHALALRADTSYEGLVTTRIRQPLGLSSTVITLDDSLQGRLAPGHNEEGERVASWTTPGVQVPAPCARPRTTCQLPRQPELLALHLMEPRFPLTTQSAASTFALLLIVVLLLEAGVAVA